MGTPVASADAAAARPARRARGLADARQPGPGPGLAPRRRAPAHARARARDRGGSVTDAAARDLAGDAPLGHDRHARRPRRRAGRPRRAVDVCRPP